MERLRLKSFFLQPRTRYFLLCLAAIPVASLLYRAFQDDLGANPVEEITHSTGLWALRFLLLSLTVTPLRQLTGWAALAPYRKNLGLIAFAYATLHFATYLILDQAFDFGDIAADIVKRRYITVGFAAFVLLTPLAATSTRTALRRLGAARWQKLHRLVFPAALCVCIHFLWLVKADLLEPLAYTSVYLVLIGWRLWRWGK
jgi:methionine sulfoxide reductase heme-binding subunit